jgi:hypothetical protein
LNASEKIELGTRHEGLDVLRGGLLTAMLAVHVLAAHATSAQMSEVQRWLGIFLISSGFVALSGFVLGLKPGPLTAKEATGAVETGVRLVLVMFGYAVLVSLLRHGLSRAAGGAEACTAMFGWLPPLRLESVGILLPIAIVQMLGPLVRWRGKLGLGVVGALALTFMSAPWWMEGLAEQGPARLMADVLYGRTLTPYYTVSTFLAVGLVASILGRLGLVRGPRSAPLRWLLVLAAVALVAPQWSQPILDGSHRYGVLAGSFATLGYWMVAVGLLLAASVAPIAPAGGLVRRAMALLGSTSLVVFLLHLGLLEFDAFARTALGAPKGLLTSGALFAADLLVLLLIAGWLRRAPVANAVAQQFVLGRARLAAPLGSGVYSLWGALALSGVLGTYSGVALAQPQDRVVIDDFEGGEGCPAWWFFGATSIQRGPSEGEPGHGERVLQVRGNAPGAFGHGMGLYMAQDLGERRTLELDVRGYGPFSGRIKLEVSEDDNGNWEIEKHPPLYIPLHDDRFVFELAVDWTGWRRVTLPLSRFRDDNPGRGNDLFDPQRDLTSGGLLELQLLFAPTGPGADQVQLDLDNLAWTP